MNERMTKRGTDGQAMMDCEKCKADWTGKHGKPMADCTALYCRNRLLGRVVEYEDTGWTPKKITTLGELFNYALKESKTLTEQLTLLKHIRKLADADKDGRCVVLPCKVGDTVYMIEHIFDIDNGVCDEICARKVIGYGGNNLNKLWLIGSGGICNAYIFVSEFGKTVFLTREEAERAIQEMEGKKDGNETNM